MQDTNFDLHRNAVHWIKLRMARLFEGAAVDDDVLRID